MTNSRPHPEEEKTTQSQNLKIKINWIHQYDGQTKDVEMSHARTKYVLCYGIVCSFKMFSHFVVQMCEGFPRFRKTPRFWVKLFRFSGIYACKKSGTALHSFGMKVVLFYCLFLRRNNGAFGLYFAFAPTSPHIYIYFYIPVINH